MICPNCRWAADLNARGFVYVAAMLHATCSGPLFCTCQHKTGSGHIRPEGAALHA